MRVGRATENVGRAADGKDGPATDGKVGPATDGEVGPATDGKVGPATDGEVGAAMDGEVGAIEGGVGRPVEDSGGRAIGKSVGPATERSAAGVRPVLSIGADDVVAPDDVIALDGADGGDGVVTNCLLDVVTDAGWAGMAAGDLGGVVLLGDEGTLARARLDGAATCPARRGGVGCEDGSALRPSAPGLGRRPSCTGGSRSWSGTPPPTLNTSSAAMANASPTKLRSAHTIAGKRRAPSS